MVACGDGDGGDAGEPASLEGVWRATPGMVLGGSCDGQQAAVLLSSDYRIEARADGGIELSYYAQNDGPLHTCAKEGSEYVCPSVALGSNSCERWDAGLRLEFVSADEATGEATYDFDCFDSDPDIPCCTGYGDNHPCTRIFAWTLTRLR